MATPHPPYRRAVAPVGLALALLLSGCDYLGIETPAAQQAREAAEGKAIGGACRHANRALEDCYRYNPKASKSAIFEGWKEMDIYMRENNLEAITPVTPAELPKPKTPPKPLTTEDGAENEEAAPAPPSKGTAKR